jgi:hypothetical protein
MPAVDRAREVGKTYQEALWKVDRAACASLDLATGWAGESWIVVVGTATYGTPVARRLR